VLKKVKEHMMDLNLTRQRLKIEASEIADHPLAEREENSAVQYRLIDLQAELYSLVRTLFHSEHLCGILSEDKFH